MKTDKAVNTNKPMWEIWKDGFISRIPWRMRTPIGVLPYTSKRSAIAVRDESLRRAAILRAEGK